MAHSPTRNVSASIPHPLQHPASAHICSGTGLALPQLHRGLGSTPVAGLNRLTPRTSALETISAHPRNSCTTTGLNSASISGGINRLSPAPFERGQRLTPPNFAPGPNRLIPELGATSDREWAQVTTAVLGLSSLILDLHRESAHLTHIVAGTGLAVAHICPGTGLTPHPHLHGPALNWPTPPASAPGLNRLITRSV